MCLVFASLVKGFTAEKKQKKMMSNNFLKNIALLATPVSGFISLMECFLFWPMEEAVIISS
jgi:hypothetical protein